MYRINGMKEQESRMANWLKYFEKAYRFIVADDFEDVDNALLTLKDAINKMIALCEDKKSFINTKKEDIQSKIEQAKLLKNKENQGFMGNITEQFGNLGNKPSGPSPSAVEQQEFIAEFMK